MTRMREDVGIYSRYYFIIKNVYDSTTFYVKLDYDLKTEKIPLVRAQDTISPKLFILALENILCETIVVNLSYLGFADDIVLLSTDIQELNTMPKELNDQSRKMGLE
ncbi:uncharacterized protein LOC115887414 [Sitophilus oryzae]|uniref:Uncharacterized protein LOC115887414 n=1 Tax=Sitophilus oryzae TaxID=7048 RepID=A0A6J2YGY3_SITOR|nr:uncharacterized protein LOC115887414 [Sitophilus oryzae]